MASAAELDRAAERAVQLHRGGDYEKAQSLFSALVLSACFAGSSDEAEHVDRIMRLLEARLPEGAGREDIRRHVESIMTHMSEPTDRFAGFSLLLRNLG